MSALFALDACPCRCFESTPRYVISGTRAGRGRGETLDDTPLRSAIRAIRRSSTCKQSRALGHNHGITAVIFGRRSRREEAEERAESKKLDEAIVDVNVARLSSKAEIGSIIRRSSR